MLYCIATKSEAAQGVLCGPLALCDLAAQMGLIDTPQGPTGANKAKAAVAIISALVCGMTPFLAPLKAEVVPLSALLWYLTVAFGMYGLQFLFVPALVVEQNFDKTPDKYHLFISRFAGFLILWSIGALWLMPEEWAYKMAGLNGGAIAILGPAIAELTLEVKPMHNMAIILQPIYAGLIVALAL